MNKFFISMAIAAAVAIVGCSKSNDDGTWLPDGSPKVNAEVVVDETLDMVNDAYRPARQALRQVGGGAWIFCFLHLEKEIGLPRYGKASLT